MGDSLKMIGTDTTMNRAEVVYFKPLGDRPNFTFVHDSMGKVFSPREVSDAVSLRVGSPSPDPAGSIVSSVLFFIEKHWLVSSPGVSSQESSRLTTLDTKFRGRGFDKVRALSATTLTKSFRLVHGFLPKTRWPKRASGPISRRPSLFHKDLLWNVIPDLRAIIKKI